MISQRILLLSFLLLYSRKIAGQFIHVCTSDEISRDEVASNGCTCRQFSPHDTCTKCPVGPSTCASEDSGICLSDCNFDCTSKQNENSDACGVWLHSVCECKQNPSLCNFQHGKGTTGWVKLGGQGNLATVDQPLRNILALQNHESLAKSAWDWGQQPFISDPSTQGLAINPVRTITQDQVHMHICDVNGDMVNFLTKISTNSAISNYQTVQSIKLEKPFIHDGHNTPDTMWCLASQTKNTPIDGGLVHDAINSVMVKPKVCNFNVAAAVIRDSNGYTWGCVTADRGDSEHRFLDKCNK
ncbi:uncharacterized protein N7469_007939 [Penicillium citrinum]|uniref:Uncharacterized protein n=1 Tax=Penicillium citrinum TaxID=5077 RepID=A0A9W9TIV0_PENCI|nr:uncharacterized protein N7469_007939 [Penicillium citrinum]KAJ5224436.1 hypothetical protein N7469_007939 [Penicillium citrinum]